jgi:hypothetical protein
MVDLSRPVWRKSTLSSTSNCVEVAMAQGQVAVHDSKNRTGPTLVFGVVNGPHELDSVPEVRECRLMS